MKARLPEKNMCHMVRLMGSADFPSSGFTDAKSVSLYLCQNHNCDLAVHWSLNR